MILNRVDNVSSPLYIAYHVLPLLLNRLCYDKKMFPNMSPNMNSGEWVHLYIMYGVADCCMIAMYDEMGTLARWSSVATMLTLTAPYGW
jgi:cytosine/uracil/thiamine/allantoin permease